MEKAIAKLSRNNHVDHITGVMPLLTAVFGVQCYLMGKFTTSINVGDLALGLGISLACFVCGLFYYDKNHLVLIYTDHIKTGLRVGQGKRINFSDIEEIIAPKDEKAFGTLILKLRNGATHPLYFVDFPLGSKDFLDQQMNKLQEQAQSMAA